MDLLKKISSALGCWEKIGGAVLDTVYSTGLRLWNVEEEAEKLRRTEKRIRAVLTDAEQRRFIDDDFVKLWLQELRATAFDVDALLDRLTTMAAVSRMAAAETSRKRKRLWLNIDLGLRQRWELDAWIARINERLDEIEKGKRNLRLRPGDGRRTTPPLQQRQRFPEAAAHGDERHVGRADQKKKIIRALVSESAGLDLPVISIWGTAGIGKTALARLVYSDPEVEKFFTDSNRFWVWLPDRCDVRVATKTIIEAVTRQKCELLSLDILQQRLREHLRKRRFLLVIDNLWAEGFQFWESLRPSLIAGEEGSKLLITTRHERVSRMMSNILNSIQLEGLKDDECWEIVKAYAFSGWSSNDHHDLELIGQRVGANCRGSPLAAKSLGVLLSDTNGQREQWESILSDMQILEGNRNTDIILASLQISYQHLPYHLKQCFALCSMYPPSLEFDKDELVRLWMADGLIKSNGRKRVEMEAGRWFDELLWRSLFETSRSLSNHQKFRVPNLMLDLALRVSKYESLTLSPDDSQVPEHPELVRYATVLCPNDEPLAFDRIYHYQKLRLLKLYPTMKLPSNQVPSALFSNLTCLRALDLSYTELEVLPDSVGCSIHLRYLNLRNTLIKTLPETVCNLFNLQTLDLRVTAFRSMPSGIDKLQSLQTLSRFVVVSRDGGKCNINELKNLKIRGELCILNLEATTDDGSKEANLIVKEYLHKLMLKWSDGTCKDEQQLDIEKSERVIEALCPHTNLKHLRIHNYPGRRLPSWVEQLSFLESLEIVSCPRHAQFSMETLQSRRNLRISVMYILPRNISRLTVNGSDALEEWY
ncbi:hypothetical protein SETIT_9G419800v2 [Setaria italica]|uniref:NB-ARC domain-containing protein n=1 Tax=Setaria italica TaxID=4555 RepID=A0A368SRH4_SETIT|nr:hypothetical protein SETIT_9G419800v2 [Setaria italica]